MFDLNTAFAVRERDDGLLERDTFDLSSATPLETPIEQPKPNWELLKDPSFKADFEVVKQSAIGQLQDVYTILGAPLKIALGMQVDPLKEFPKIVDYLTQPRSVPPLTSANIKGVLTGKGIVETTEGVPGDISILDGLFLAWGGQQALKGFTGAIQYNKAIDKMIATEELKTAEEAVAYNIAQDLSKYERMFVEGGEFPAGVDNDTKVRVIMNNLDNNPQLKTEVFADTALRIKGIDPNTIIETTAEAEGLQPSNLLNKLKRINELVGERGSVIIPKVGQNVSYGGKPGKIIKVEGKLAEVQFLGEKTTAIVALNQLQVPKVEKPTEGKVIFKPTGDKEFDTYVAGVYKEFEQSKSLILKQAQKIDKNITDVRLGGSYGKGKPNKESDIDLEFSYNGNPPEKLYEQLAGRFEIGGGFADAGVISSKLSTPTEGKVEANPEEALYTEARKYKSAEEFRKAVNQSNLMDLSNPEKHNLGRAFASYPDEPLTDISDIIKTGDNPGSYLSTIKYEYPDVYKKIISPQKTITIYRAVPENIGDEIRIGDYVTLDKKYAQMHLESVLQGEQKVKGKIISKIVPKKDIVWGEADFQEWAYSPRELREKYPTLTDIWNKANAVSAKPEEPIHINNLNITPAAKQHLEATIESIKPELEEIKGDTLTYDEILEAAKTSEILTSATSRAATKEFNAKLLRTRQHLAALAEQKGVSQEFIDALKAVRAAGTDLARGLGSLNIEAQGEEYTLKTRIVNELTDMGVQMEEIIQAAEGVDFTNQEQVTKFYRQFVKPKLWDLLNEYRYINLLSSPKTHIVNAFSNLLQVSGLAPGTKLFMGDVKGAKAFYVGAFNAVGDAWVKAWDALKGKTFVERPDVKHIPTGNKLLKPLRYIPQALEASDVFFRTIAYEGELAAQLGKGANQKDAENLAKEKASYFVFRKALDPANKTGQGHLLSAIDHLTSLAYKARSIPILGRVIGWYIPFVQTPMNIAKQMIEYSPAGFTTLPGAKDKKEQLAKALLGSFIFGLAAYLVSKNDTTWSVPTSKKEKDLFFAAGRQPFSIKLGNTWIGYSRLGPLAFPIAIPAAIKHYTQDNPKSVTDNTIQKTSKVIGGLGEFFASMSYMEGIGSLMDLVKNAPGAAAKFAVEAPSQFIAVSSLQRWVNNYIIDPIYRKTDKEISAEAIVDNARKSIIFATKGLPAYETPEGEKSRRSYPRLNAFSPIPVSKSNKVYEAEYKQYIETRKEDILNKQDTTEEAVRKPRRR